MQKAYMTVCFDEQEIRKEVICICIHSGLWIPLSSWSMDLVKVGNDHINHLP